QGGMGNGGQIVPPVDTEIAEKIDEVAAGQNILDLPRGEYKIAEEDLISSYISITAGAANFESKVRPLKVVYTAMHGVGWEVFNASVKEAGFADPIPVGPQIEPDPLFSTVAFPNPEE